MIHKALFCNSLILGLFLAIWAIMAPASEQPKLIQFESSNLIVPYNPVFSTPVVVGNSESNFDSKLELKLESKVASRAAQFLASFGVSAQVSTLGWGVNLSHVLVTDYLTLRFQLNQLQLDVKDNGNSYHYSGDLPGLLLDYAPFAGVFRFSGGIYFDNRQLNTTSGTVSLNNDYYAYGQAGVRFNALAPYVGIGVGSQAAYSPEKSGVLIALDLGILYENPQLYANLECNQSLSASCNDFEQYANSYKQQLQQDLVNWISYYPVVSFSLGYRF